MPTPDIKLDIKALKAAVEKAIGHSIYQGDSQGHKSFCHGMAVVRIYGNTWNFNGVLNFRCEGSGHPTGQTPDEVLIPMDIPNWFDLVVGQIVEVLSTGRTVEVGKGIGQRGWIFEVRDQYVSEPWDDLVLQIRGQADRTRTEPWDLNPDYQRGAVWTKRQQERYIGHILSGGTSPLIYCQRYDRNTNAPKGTDYMHLPIEVIDGQQRLRAVCAFIDGDIGGQVFHDREWHTYFYVDMDEVERRGLRMSEQVVYVDMSRQDRLRFYHRLNGGTAHTEEELARVQQMIIDEFGEGE
jgi:hypothetical protein